MGWISAELTFSPRRSGTNLLREILFSYSVNTQKARMDVILSVHLGQISGGMHEVLWIVMHRLSSHVI